jgi:hypothetical protein
MSRLEQRAVIRYLTLKNLTVAEIATELQGVYGRDALKYSTVSKWRLRFLDGSEDLFDLARSGRLPRSDLATPIQQLLQQFPFISCKVLCHKLKIGKATCLRVLHDDLHLEKFNLRYIPHSLEDDQKRSRVELSEELLEILQQDRQNNFEHILTGDESWFFLQYFHHSCWSANPEEVPEIPRQEIHSEKWLISIIWRGTGVKSLLSVPKGLKYNATFFVESAVPDLFKHGREEGRRKMLRGIMVHLDNARPHYSRKSNEALRPIKARRIPAPAYSPDLSPSDFFVFGMLKERLSGSSYSSPDELISAIGEVIASIPRDELVRVYENWIKRLRWVITHRGEYYHK